MIDSVAVLIFLWVTIIVGALLVMQIDKVSYGEQMSIKGEAVIMIMMVIVAIIIVVFKFQ